MSQTSETSSSINTAIVVVVVVETTKVAIVERWPYTVSGGSNASLIPFFNYSYTYKFLCMKILRTDQSRTSL